MSKFSPSCFQKAWATALVGSAVVALAGSASAQFSTDFNPPTYVRGQSLNGQNGWTSNDPDGGTYTFGSGSTGNVGGTDDVSTVSGFTQQGNLSDYAATLGGQFAPDNVPGNASPTLTHTLTLGTNMGTAQISLDFGISQSQANGNFPTHDSFGFGINGPNGGLAFSVNFVPSANTAFDNITLSTTTGTTAALASVALGTRVHLVLNVNQTAQTFTATIGGVTLPTTAYAANGLTTFNAIWNLTNTTHVTASDGGTAYTNPGDNTLAFDNLQSAVPEPSTYVMLGAGALCLLAVARRRTA